MMSISTTLFGEISHASLFFTGQLRNHWQMLAEPWGSAEPRLKNTDVRTDVRKATRRTALSTTVFDALQSTATLYGVFGTVVVSPSVRNAGIVAKWCELGPKLPSVPAPESWSPQYTTMRPL